MISLGKVLPQYFWFGSCSSSMMLHCPTGPSVPSLLNLSRVSQETLPELELSSSRTPHFSENTTASYTQLQTGNENQAFVQTTLVPSLLGSGENEHGIAGAYKLILYFSSRVIYIYLACIWRWRAGSWAVLPGMQHRSHGTLPPASSFPLSFLHTFPVQNADRKPLFYQHFSTRRIFFLELLPALLSWKRVWKESSWKDDSRASHLLSDINKYLLFGIKTAFTPQSAVLQHHLYTTFILHFYWELFISNKSCCDAWETFAFNTRVVF